MSTSLSQGIGKRTSGKSRVDASVADIQARSRYRGNRDTGCNYSFYRSGNRVYLEFCQTGTCHNLTRQAYIGELSKTGFKSLSNIVIDSVTFSWDELSELIGCSTERLMRNALAFGARLSPVEAKSARDRYASRVENRHKRDRAKRPIKGIRIC